MPTLKTYDLFITHAWTYNEDYYRLVKMLGDAPNFTWRNYSVPKHDPLLTGNDTALRRQLDQQIRPVNAVLILSGMYAAYRKWFEEEIAIADSYSKPIIGIAPWGQERHPQRVDEVAKITVKWQTSSIVEAIRQFAI